MHSTAHDRLGGIDFSSLRVPGLAGCEHFPGEFALPRKGGILRSFEGKRQTSNVVRRRLNKSKSQSALKPNTKAQWYQFLEK